MIHDYIGLGEDGPTHQPFEQLAGLRAEPRLLVFRPADGNETAGAYKVSVTNRDAPTVIALSGKRWQQTYKEHQQVKLIEKDTLQVTILVKKFQVSY